MGGGTQDNLGCLQFAAWQKQASASKRMYGQFEFNFAEAFNYDHCLMQNLITAFYDRAFGVRCAGA